MTVEIDDYSSIKRKLIFRDALTFLSLVLFTVVLFLVTFFLFRSFASHREELARRWSARGQAALSAGRPVEAISALRTALSYAPAERSYEMLLAQALGEAGHTEESYNYFLSLWETQPGDGFINLSLARLAGKKNDTQAAINYYHAAIYGTWEGDGTARRREVRIELARFLIAHHDAASARNIILVAAGNAPDDVPLALTLAQLLEQAGDAKDALSFYQNILLRDPLNRVALLAAGRLQFAAGDFQDAQHLFDLADHKRAAGTAQLQPLPAEVQTMFDEATQLLALAPLKTLPAAERVERILKARALAKARLDACTSQLASNGGQPGDLQSLSAAWTGKDATVGQRVLLRDDAAQTSAMKLVLATEVETSQLCGEPSGDDAALLLLARYPKTMER